MNRKGQAAMEFLMTYGWAILVVLAAIAALAYFGVLSPDNLLPERTTFTAPLPNVDNALVSATTTDSSVEIAFRNNVGVKINITGDGAASKFKTETFCDATTVEVNVNGAGYTADATVSNGEGFLIRWTCADITSTNVNIGDKFEATLNFQYTNTETGQTRTHIGTVSSKFQ